MTDFGEHRIEQGCLTSQGSELPPCYLDILQWVSLLWQQNIIFITRKSNRRGLSANVLSTFLPKDSVSPNLCCCCCFLARNYFIRSSLTSFSFDCSPLKVWGTPRAEQICPLLQELQPRLVCEEQQQDAAVIVGSSGHLSGSAAVPPYGGSGGSPLKWLQGSWWQRVLMYPFTQALLPAVWQRLRAECLQRDWIIAAFLFSYQCRWSNSSSAAGHSLSVLAFSLSR